MTTYDPELAGAYVEQLRHRAAAGQQVVMECGPDVWLLIDGHEELEDVTTAGARARDLRQYRLRRSEP